jgi:hypothetical protein
MLDAKNNLALRSYMNFKQYRDTVEMLDGKSVKADEPVKKGIMSFSKGGVSRQAKAISENGQDKELRKVLEYVKMIEGMNNGS